MSGRGFTSYREPVPRAPTGGEVTAADSKPVHYTHKVVYRKSAICAGDCDSREMLVGVDMLFTPTNNSAGAVAPLTATATAAGGGGGSAAAAATATLKAVVARFDAYDCPGGTEFHAYIQLVDAAAFLAAPSDGITAPKTQWSAKQKQWKQPTAIDSKHRSTSSSSNRKHKRDSPVGDGEYDDDADANAGVTESDGDDTDGNGDGDGDGSRLRARARARARGARDRGGDGGPPDYPHDESSEYAQNTFANTLPEFGDYFSGSHYTIPTGRRRLPVINTVCLYRKVNESGGDEYMISWTTMCRVRYVLGLHPFTLSAGGGAGGGGRLQFHPEVYELSESIVLEIFSGLRRATARDSQFTEAVPSGADGGGNSVFFAPSPYVNLKTGVQNICEIQTALETPATAGGSSGSGRRVLGDIIPVSALWYLILQYVEWPRAKQKPTAPASSSTKRDQNPIPLEDDEDEWEGVWKEPTND